MRQKAIKLFMFYLNLTDFTYKSKGREIVIYKYIEIARVSAFWLIAFHK